MHPVGKKDPPYGPLEDTFTEAPSLLFWLKVRGHAIGHLRKQLKQNTRKSGCRHGEEAKGVSVNGRPTASSGNQLSHDRRRESAADEHSGSNDAVGSRS